VSVVLTPDARPEIRWFPQPPKTKYWADPFPIIIDKKPYVLCEEYDYRLGKGRIVSMELADEAGQLNPKPAFELPIHVSYPFLISHQDNVYCIPETKQAEEIGLYKMDAFPDRWTKITVLVSNFAGVDGTVFQYDGRWWLTASTGGKYSALNLYVWHASSLFGPWKAHGANPVKVTNASSRPAGTPFEDKGELYRPAQDCSRTYGGRIVLNRIVKLTPTEFKEEEAAVLEPRPDEYYPDGIHTISTTGNLTLIDGKRLKFSTSALKNGLKERGLLPG